MNMPKSMSNELRGFIKNCDPNIVGVGLLLARAAIKYDFRIIDLAKAFGVTRMTIHTWFRGGYIRHNNTRKIIFFLSLIEDYPQTMKIILKNESGKKLFLTTFSQRIKTLML